MPYAVQPVSRSVAAVLLGTFTLRFSTGLTGALLVYYLAELPRHGGEEVDPRVLGLLTAMFFVAELVLSPVFGVLSDRLGQRPIMQLGPGFGIVAAVLTGITTNIPLLGGTRLLEGGSSAASVPSILGYIARATATDERVRGRVVARFELATLAGLGLGLVAAGPLWDGIHRLAFFLNALLYLASWMIYRFAVEELPEALQHAPLPAQHYGWRRYVAVLLSSHVWLLAPTWIAINAALGLWTTQSLFQLVRQAEPKLSHAQRLMGGFSAAEVSLGVGIGLIVFFAGLLYWGNRFKNMRRTTIIFYGVGGGALAVAAAFGVNHSHEWPLPAIAAAVLVAGFGLFVLAGATPAALGLLADISESYPQDRGAIMGLYSVFLALGQISGSLIGGEAAHLNGIDGILVATLILVAVAVLPLWRLRAYEHLVGARLPHHGAGMPSIEPGGPGLG